MYEDGSGPEMARLLKEMSAAPDFSLNMIIRTTAVVPDDIGTVIPMKSCASCKNTNLIIVICCTETIQRVVTQWCEPGNAQSVDLVLTSGGTGFGLRDLTPEAIRPLMHREAPGVAQALLNEGLKHTPLAVLSRPVVGTRFATLVCTLPGRYILMSTII